MNFTPKLSGDKVDYRVIVILFLLFMLGCPLDSGSDFYGIWDGVGSGDEKRFAGVGVSVKNHPYFFFEPLNINSATIEQLCLIPGVGPKYAERIIKKRQDLGMIKNIDQLMKIDGIGKVRADNIINNIEFN